MKDYPYVPGWRLNKENNKPAIKHSILMLTTHGVAEGEWNGNEWIQYRWSCKVNDSDVLYWIHLEDLTQLEKEGENIQQEQPGVDLEKEVRPIWENKKNRPVSFKEFISIARHFWNKGYNARKEE